MKPKVIAAVLVGHQAQNHQEAVNYQETVSYQVVHRAQNLPVRLHLLPFSVPVNDFLTSFRVGCRCAF